MAITTYAELKSAVGNWLERAGTTIVTSNVDNWIALGEAEINVELQGIRKTKTSTTSLTGTTSSRNIAISGLTDFLSARALVLTTDGVEKVLRPYLSRQMPRRTANGYPSAWTLEGDNIVLDAPCDQAHTFEFFYDAKWDIATDSTNWLLTNYPNIYLFKSLKQAAIFLKDVPAAQGYENLAESDILKLRNAESSNNRAVLTVDPALVSRGRATVSEIDAGVW